jgi:hypothetical protein
MAKSAPTKRSVHQALPVLSTAEELGLFGAIALQATIRAGSDPGYRDLKTHPGFGTRLAPHRALRHRVLMALLDAGVIAPVGSRRRLDDSLSEASWEDSSLEDSNWSIVWDDVTRGGLDERLAAYIDGFESTAGTRAVLLDTWQALGVGECISFGEYALSVHNLNPALARAAAPSLRPLLAQHSIGQGCALMWTAAKNVASWFLRNGGGANGLADRELIRSIHAYSDRARQNGQSVVEFSRHSAVPFSTLTGSFLFASRLGDAYWSSPISEMALDRARPVDIAGDSELMGTSE